MINFVLGLIAGILAAIFLLHDDSDNTLDKDFSDEDFNNVNDMDQEDLDKLVDEAKKYKKRYELLKEELEEYGYEDAWDRLEGFDDDSDEECSYEENYD